MMARRLAPWIATLGLFLLWEAAVRIFGVPEFVLPAPSRVFAALWEFRVAIWHNAAFTFRVTLAGFAIAVALGVAVGASALVYAAASRSSSPSTRSRRWRSCRSWSSGSASAPCRRSSQPS